MKWLIIGILLGSFIGSTIGLFVAAFCISAGKADFNLSDGDYNESED